jgi:hypothetical protein
MTAISRWLRSVRDDTTGQHGTVDAPTLKGSQRRVGCEPFEAVIF